MATACIACVAAVSGLASAHGEPVDAPGISLVLFSGDVVKLDAHGRWDGKPPLRLDMGSGGNLYAIVEDKAGRRLYVTAENDAANVETRIFSLPSLAYIGALLGTSRRQRTEGKVDSLMHT